MLNARGEAQVWLGTGAYTFVLKTSAGVTIWTADGVQREGDLVTALRTDLADDADEDLGAGLVGYSDTLPYAAGTLGAEVKSLGTRIGALSVTARDLGCDPTGTDDCLALLQGAIDDGYTIDLGYGIYAISGELVIKDGTGLIGRRPHWKRRTGYEYSATQNTVLKYTGTGGSNTCVVRLSEKAVSIVGTDFTTPGTDDLLNVQCTDVHVDGGGTGVEYGWYIYRCGNSSKALDRLTAEGCAKAGILMLGMFAGYEGVLGAYSNAGRGIVIGKDEFGWGTEANCYSLHCTAYAANNGTAGTFVEGSATDEDGCGVWVAAGRGSTVQIGAEGNDGRSCVLSGHTGGGPATFKLDYLEGNGAGPRIDYRPAFVGMRVEGGFLFPRNGTLAAENILIVARTNAGTVTTDEGPIAESDWLVLSNLTGTLGGGSFAIDSNTNKYKVRDCSGGISYLNKFPCPEGTFGVGQFLGDSTLSDISYIKGRTRVDTFVGDGSDPTFTLSAEPTGAAQMEVYKNLVLQTPTSGYTVSGTTLTMASAPALGAIGVVKYSDMKLVRTSAGVYTVTFGQALPDAFYDVQATVIHTTGNHFAFVGAKSATGFEIRTVTPGTPGTPVDSSKYITFSVSRATS